MQIINFDGFASLLNFFLAAFTPELNGSYLQRTLDAALTTLAFSFLGALLAGFLGFFGGLALSSIWGHSFNTSRLSKFSASALNGYSIVQLMLRLFAALPRGIHESIWAIIFIIILGSNPVVGVLALGIPFGAITAKVFADMLDSANLAPYRTLLAAGSTRVQALFYGLLPQVKNPFIAYVFYRFDCALRSAVILGMIGAGGIGFELLTAFQGLNYPRMWTQIYALLLLGILAEQWSKKLRQSNSWQKTSIYMGLVLAIVSICKLQMDLPAIFSERSLNNLLNLVDRALPPALPDTWLSLFIDSLETIGISIGAIIIGAALGLFGAALSVYPPRAGFLRRALAYFSRISLIFLRSLSPPIWALLLLFIIFPGPLPGAIALGLYNAGVIGRLLAETIEEMEQGPVEALNTIGASALQKFSYATFPSIAVRFSDLSLYRWEVAIRESIVVGVVGAGGLGRLLESERAAFDYPALLTVILTLIFLSFLVDLLSAGIRKKLTLSRQL